MVNIVVNNKTEDKAVEVEKLYGITHMQRFETLLESFEVKLRPSFGLIEELSKLPKGTVVGIEQLPPKAVKELTKVTINGNVVKTDFEPQYYYWKQIAYCGRTHGLKIVRLESADAFKKLQTKTAAYSEVVAKINKTEDAEERKTLGRDAYAKLIEMNYYHQVKREEALLKSIIEMKPNVVILGQGHTAVLMDRYKNAQIKGVVFKSYAIEELPDGHLERAGYTIYYHIEKGSSLRTISRELTDSIIPQLKQQNEPSSHDKKLLLDRQMLERRYSAIKNGRITDKNPDFIGTWDLDLPAQGLFELFILDQKGKELYGVIEDIFGIARFYGGFDSGKFNFIKIYDENAIMLGGDKKPISYSGIRKENKFVGDYGSGSEQSSHFPFEMQPVKSENTALLRQ